MPTMTVTAAGLDFTATVVGSGGGVVTLSASAPTRPPEPVDWRQVGTRTGDGTIIGTLPVGPHWFYAATTAGPTPPAFALLTAPGEDSLPTRCRDAVVAALTPVTSFPFAAVHDEPYPDAANKTGPWLSVSVGGLRERIAPGLNCTNDVAYPVRVLYCDKHHLRDKAKPRSRYDPFRLVMTDLFHRRRLAGVIESIQCEVEPLDVLDPRQPAYQMVASGVLVWCWTRRAR